MKIVLCFLILGCLSQQLTPIPSPADGFYQGPLVSNYTLDVFYDHLCVDSKNAFPALYDYWQSNQAWLGLNIHIMPLPYHAFSFVVAQAGRYIQESYPTRFMNFVSFMFENQDVILKGYVNWDFPTVQIQVAALTNQATAVPNSEILNALNDDNVYYSTVISWKYAASRTMTGTPLYLVNDVWVPILYNYTTVAEWDTFFNGLD